MAKPEKKVEVRFGAFKCSIEGYDDPVAQLRDVLGMMQKMIAETPQLGEAGQSFDPDPISDALSETSPGIVVIRNDDSVAATAAEMDKAEDASADNAKATPETDAAPVTGWDDTAYAAPNQPFEPAPEVDVPAEDNTDITAPLHDDIDQGFMPDPVPEPAPEPLIEREPAAEASPIATPELDPEPSYETSREREDGPDNGADLTAGAIAAAAIVGTASILSTSSRDTGPAEADQVTVFEPEHGDAAPIATDLSPDPAPVPEEPAARNIFAPPPAPETEAPAAPVEDRLPPPSVEVAATERGQMNIFAAPTAAASPQPERETAAPNIFAAAPGGGSSAPVAPPPADGGIPTAPPPAEPAGATHQAPDPSPTKPEFDLEEPPRPEKPARGGVLGSVLNIFAPAGGKAPSAQPPQEASEQAAPAPTPLDPTTPESVDTQEDHPTPEPEPQPRSASGFQGLLQRVHGAPMMSAPGESATTPPPSETAQPAWPDAGELSVLSGDQSISGQLASAAAWLTLVNGQSSFSRREVMEVLETIPSDGPRELVDRIRGFGRLVRSGRLVLIDDGVFAMAQPDRDRFQRMIRES